MTDTRLHIAFEIPPRAVTVCENLKYESGGLVKRGVYHFIKAHGDLVKYQNKKGEFFYIDYNSLFECIKRGKIIL